jgi:hypothetical protein
MTTHLPHVDMMAEAVEVVELVLLLFWLCFVSSCLLEEIRVKGFGVTKVPTLEDGVGLLLAVVLQGEVG